MSCSQASSGCNFPEGDCLGVCRPEGMGSPPTVAASLESRIKGKCIKEVWPHGPGVEIVFTDDSHLLITAPFAFKPAATVATKG